MIEILVCLTTKRTTATGDRHTSPDKTQQTQHSVLRVAYSFYWVSFEITSPLALFPSGVTPRPAPPRPTVAYLIRSRFFQDLPVSSLLTGEAAATTLKTPSSATTHP
ncbi:hypothetical protein L1887_30531 [Cichorium endivia]|nr:hypothetical protein L1887_30531 [Cichorium endivia]